MNKNVKLQGDIALNSLINDFTTKCSMRNMQIIIIVEKIFIKNP